MLKLSMKLKLPNIFKKEKTIYLKAGFFSAFFNAQKYLSLQQKA